MGNTVANPTTIASPAIDSISSKKDVNGEAVTRYTMVSYAANRAKEINTYENQLADGMLTNIGPLIDSEKGDPYLSVALKEIDEEKLLLVPEEINENEDTSEKISQEIESEIEEFSEELSEELSEKFDGAIEDLFKDAEK
ncbi:MAG: DNA-directed RNA polymerase subunit omega [Bifidobacteriaceae bacterium]|jgi:DNA-directed RNA polymerase subunit omega|nr:DNA-directed RNA polymerase subunit omega [Bifidobacteriaceae bacterium]